jgi:UDP-N-acetylmuramoyl-L-alanyl-D-glutamate--2,6-diaminopimelate ligase
MVPMPAATPPPYSSPPPSMRLGDVVRELADLAPSLRFFDESAERAITGLRHDSRAVEAGDVFVARAGARSNGLEHVSEAIARGAVAVVAQRGAFEGSPGVPVIEVSDVPLALAMASAAIYGHPTFSLEVVGITGTNGKTTTTQLCRSMIDAGEGRCGTIGTLGYQLYGHTQPSPFTSPEADEIARVARSMRDRGATHLVMEVSSIALAAKRVDGVRFRVGAFTNLTQDHLDYHGTMEAYFEAKMRLFSDLEPGAVAVHVGDERGRAVASRVRPGARMLRFARQPGPGVDVAPAMLRTGSFGLSLLLDTPAGSIEVESPLVGLHNVENLLCAASIGLLLDLAPLAISEGLSRSIVVPGRLERCDDPDVDDVVVLVDYAHTPDALERVLGSVRAFTTGQVVVVFGCGGDRDPLKRPLMGEAAGRGADWAIVTNDNPRSEDPRAIVEQIVPALASTGTPFEVELDRAAAIRRAVLEASRGDVVLVAGKGHETYQIVGGVTHAFDDRVEARAALRERRTRAEAP